MSKLLFALFNILKQLLRTPKADQMAHELAYGRIAAILDFGPPGGKSSHPAPFSGIIARTSPRAHREHAPPPAHAPPHAHAPKGGAPVTATASAGRKLNLPHSMQSYTILKLIMATVLAIVPAVVWGYIFWKKQVGKKSMVLRTFLVGAFFVVPLLAYKYLWQYFPWLNAFEYTHPLKDDLIGFSSLGFIPLEVIATFMIVGVIEEITKLWAVKLTDKKTILSIDDAIEMFIMAALGFSFAENMLYFYNIITSKGIDSIIYPFVFRSLFSTFAHVMFSGVLGYFYGLAIFATDVVKDKHNLKRWPVTKLFAQIFHLKKEVVFHEEKMTQGLLIAIILHAIFNIFLEMNWTFFLVPYLTAGYIYLNYLLEKKDYHKVYALVDNNRNDIVQ